MDHHEHKPNVSKINTVTCKYKVNNTIYQRMIFLPSPEFPRVLTPWVSPNATEVATLRQISGHEDAVGDAVGLAELDEKPWGQTTPPHGV